MKLKDVLFFLEWTHPDGLRIGDSGRNDKGTMWVDEVDN